jgi:hypothetical protein
MPTRKELRESMFKHLDLSTKPWTGPAFTPGHPNPTTLREQPEKIAMCIGFSRQKPRLINVDRALTFNHCLEEIRRRFPAMTLGDG